MTKRHGAGPAESVGDHGRHRARPRPAGGHRRHRGAQERPQLVQLSAGQVLEVPAR
ncbi:hypothetical protein QJS66_06455 [Kocuria rhizophila]|nr:hypothetical protein QJS66_06455 [Kocuria rhizophila]